MKLLNFFKRNKEKENKRKWLKITLVIFLLFILVGGILSASVFSYQYFHTDRIYRGVQIDGNPLGGKTMELLNTFLNRRVDGIHEAGLNFFYQDKESRIDTVVRAVDEPSLSYEILYIDTDKMAGEAFNYGRSGEFLVNLKDQVIALIAKKQITTKFKLNDRELSSIIEKEFEEYLKPAQNAYWDFGEEGITIVAEQQGSTLDIRAAIEDLVNTININSIEPIELRLVDDIPEVVETDLDLLQPDLSSFLTGREIVFEYTNEHGDLSTWELGEEEYKHWITIKKNDETKNLQLIFDEEKLLIKLQEIAAEINIEPQDAKFIMEDNYVKEFIPSKDGVELDIKKALIEINEIVFTKGELKVDLPIKTWEPEVATGDTNDLGIVERIGFGTTNYSGSPANRRHNIANGISRISGSIIKPGEEFQTIPTLRPINAAGGYLQELVIKGNETKPEFGGGLCQVSTTLFRSVLNAGLKITARRNHSYRVSYYEPPVGMDATVYDPWPDFRFVNDTANHILIIGYTIGNDAYFEIWGTRDGRKAETTDPVVYNITSPPPTKIVETLDLAPGQRRCTESAHNGADASFDYIVTYKDGTSVTETFNSHFRAWQAVCLVGVESLTVEGDEVVDDGEAPVDDIIEESPEPAILEDVTE